MFDYDALINQLSDLREESYAVFSSKLSPESPPIWGIRLPNLRKIARQMRKIDVREYFPQVKHEFFEETLLMGFVIGTMEEPKYSLDEIQNLILDYLPHICSWSVCDPFCASLKIAKTESSAMFRFLEKIFQQNVTWKSCNDNKKLQIAFVTKEKEYIIRFVIVMWLNYYLKDDYIDFICDYLKTIKTDQYYVNMAVAWCFSMIYVNYPERVEEFLETNIMHVTDLNPSDRFVHNKIISKICDSYQVEKEKKDKIRPLRIKNMNN